MRLPAVALLQVVLLSCTHAVTNLYDELLYTKQAIWNMAKVENALMYTNPSELEPKLQDVYPSIRGSIANSLDGPHPKRDGSNAPDDTEWVVWTMHAKLGYRTVNN